MAVTVWLGRTGLLWAGNGLAVEVWIGPIWSVQEVYGGHGESRLGLVRNGGAGSGEAVIFWRHGARVPAICE